MKLARTVLASALTLTFAAPTLASDVQIYGKANVTFQSSNEGSERFTELKSNASRFGIKGDLKLEEGLEVVYKYEVQIDLADEAGEKNLKSRNQYVGLRGSFGEVLLGRNDTMLKQSQGKVDLFNDYEADLKSNWKGENRMGDSITYKSPKFSNFQVGVTYITEDSAGGQEGISTALMYGDAKLKKSNFYGAIAFDSDVKGYDSTRLTGHFKVSGVKLGLAWHTQENTASGADADGYLANAAYSMNKTTFKVQYQTLEDDSTLSLGVDYKLGKQTKLFAWFSDFDKDAGTDKDYLAIGIEHKF
jgi:predicted porin